MGQNVAPLAFHTDVPRVDGTSDHAMIRLLPAWDAALHHELLHRELRLRLAAGACTVSIDVSELRSLSSLTVGTLVCCHTTCARAGARLTLEGVDDMQRRILDRTHLDRILEVRPRGA